MKLIIPEWRQAMRLIPEWRQAWRMLSVRFYVLLGGWIMLTHEQQMTVLDALPFDMTPKQMAGTLVVLGLLGRLKAQPKVRP